MNQNRDVVASNLGPHCPDATCRRDVLSILLILKIEAIRSHGRVWKYKGTAKVDGKRMADAEWSATIVDRKE